MNIFFNKNYIYVLLLFMVAGCESLDLAPKDEVSDASFWQTTNHFKLAANDFYFSLQEAHNYTDVNSDIAFGAGANAVSNGSYLPTANTELWTDSYTGIRGTNYLLEKAETSPLGPEIDRWVGEALFFRAYHYWKLTKTYGGVPLITGVLSTDSPDLYSERSTQKESIDFIIADLDNAIPKLPLQSELPAEELGRVTKYAALALQSRVAL